MGPSPSRGTICILLIVALIFGGVTIARAQVPCTYYYDEDCKALIKKVAIISAIVVAGVIALKIVTGNRAEARRNAPPANLNVYYDPTNGQALYHVVMSPRANCPDSWSVDRTRLVSGRLPPGMNLDNDHNITGTPDVPGTWEAAVLFTGLSCRGRDGRRQNYADQTVRVTIRIAE